MACHGRDLGSNVCCKFSVPFDIRILGYHNAAHCIRYYKEVNVIQLVASYCDVPLMDIPIPPFKDYALVTSKNTAR